MICNVKTKKGLIKTTIYIDFILMYTNQIEGLNKSMTEKIFVDLKDLCDIINEKISKQGYEIDDNMIYSFEKESSDRLNFLTFYLKKKEKVKIKKKGSRKYV